MNEPYKYGSRPDEHRKKRRRRKIIWLIILLLFVLSIIVAVIIIRSRLKPHTTVKQAAAVTKTVNYQDTTKHYDEPDFGIDLPATWIATPRPAGPYQTYNWQFSDKGSKGAQVAVFEDTIPVNFASNRIQIVEGADDRLQLVGQVSDNCASFTKGLTPTHGQIGVPAKYLNVDFTCDQGNLERDVIGISSSDGINTVILKSPTTGAAHKFFISYTNQDISPDYTTFQTILSSLRMK